MPGRIDRLFENLDLLGTKELPKKDQQNVRELITQYHHLFALDDFGLGKTSLGKHGIKLDNYTPFKDRYRRIPPHQHEEVRKHLKDMIYIRAIRRSNSPWVSAVVLVRMKDGS